MFEQPDFNHHMPSQKRRTLSTVTIVFLLIIGFLGARWTSSLFAKEINIDNNQTLWGKVLQILPFVHHDEEAALPSQEKDRLDVLILGIRGSDDPDGGMLTDTMILFSYDKKTKKSALVSIPRDLYVPITPQVTDKINSAYERIGLQGTKKLVSRLTGVYIDNAVVFDFGAFDNIITKLGGIDIYLDKPFTETQQWGYTFSLPAGENHLNSEQALYYARSRFTSTDFDRSARQQKIILAIQQKVRQLNILANPGDALSIFNSVRTHLKTDFNITDTGQLISLGKEINSTQIKREVISTDNLVYDTRTASGSYILLPKDPTLNAFKEYFQNVLNDISPTPNPSK